MTLPTSRALILPGPQPPLSHFGVTLLRHVFATGLRYSLYQLGLTPPERPPVRIVGLRLYIDGSALEATPASKTTPAPEETPASATTPASETTRVSRMHRADDRQEIFGALTCPGGSAEAAGRSAGLRGAVLFHRTRLRLHLRRRPPPPVLDGGASPQQLWALFRDQLQAELPALGDALLGEILAAMARRRRRGRGQEVAPCLGSQAWRLRAGRRARLSHLGPPDLLRPSWASIPESAARTREAFADRPVPRPHALRGAFREALRAGLDRLRIPYLALAEAATERGLLGVPEEAFFLPFDLGHELCAGSPPDWLADAIAANRREYEVQLDRPSPPEEVLRQTVSLGHAAERTDWSVGPLWPLK